MGAKIDGIGTETLTIEGVDRLHGATYSVMADRIEAGSYACAAAITGGSVELVGVAAARYAGDGRGAASMRASTVEERKAAACVDRADGRLEAADAVDRALSRASRPTCRRNSWRC